jgi:hypothetical protein
MASNAQVLKQIGNLLMQRSTVRNRVRGSEPVGLSRRPNAPRFVTIILAVALTVIGLAVTVHPIQPVIDLLDKGGIELSKEQGWLALHGSPLLLVIGAFFRGI